MLARLLPLARPALGAARLHLARSARRQFKLTDIGEGITEVELLKWHVRPGSVVAEFDKLCEVQSDKAAVEITSRFAGIIKTLCVPEGKMAKVGQPLVEFEPETEAGLAAKSEPAQALDSGGKLVTPHLESNTGAAAAAAVSIADSSMDSSSKKLASPAVRYLARQSNVDLALVTGTGKDGRILKEDLVQHVAATSANATARVNGSRLSSPRSVDSLPISNLPSAASGSYTLTSTIVPVRGIQREMAKTMTASLSIPHLTLMEEVKIDAALSALNKRATLLAFLIKAASCALLEYPTLNASYSAERQELLVYAQHNVQVAVDTPKGLVTPVIFNVESKSIAQVAEDLNRIKMAATNGSLSPSDFKNGTFTVSNIGSIGGTYATPVIAPPLVAIGAFGRAKRVPRFVSEQSSQVEAAKIMAVSWAADHRVIDGATVAKFSNAFVKLVEEPGALMVRLK